MSSNTMNMSSILAALAAIESQVASVRSAISSESKPATAPKGKRASAKQAPAAVAADAPAKPKREINPKIAAMNDERKVIFAEMKGAWALANPAFASLDAAALKKAVAAGEVSKPPSFPDAIKEHSRRLRENDPAAEARHQAYLEKRAKKDAASAPASAPAPAPKPADAETVASTTSSGSKGKRGPKPGFKLSDEEKQKRAAKRAENAALKKAAGVPPLPPSPVSDA